MSRSKWRNLGTLEWTDQLLPGALRSRDSEAMIVPRRLAVGLIAGIVAPTVSALRYWAAGSLSNAIIAASTAAVCLAVFALIWLLRSARLPTHLLLVALAGLMVVVPAIAETGTPVHGGALIVPLAASLLLGARAGVVWSSLVGVTLASVALRIPIDDPLAPVAWQLCIISVALGIGAAALEAIRHRAVLEALATDERGRDQRARVRAFVEEAFPSMLEVADATVVYASPGIGELLGAPPDALIGRSMADFVSEAEYERIAYALDSAPDRSHHIEVRAHKLTGEPIWVEMFAIPYPHQPGEDRWILTGRDVGVEKRERERRISAEKLESLALLSAGVAHDFNNLLTVIGGFADRLRDEEAREQILQAVEDASSLTAQLMVFTHEHSGERGPTDLSRMLHEMRPVLRSLVGDRVQLEIGVRDRACTALADALQIKRVLINLVSNARDAMSDGGRIHIGLTQQQLDGDVARQLDLAPGRYFELSVSDDGCGMNQETVRRALDPFFTTKSVGEGFGLGLATVRDIASQHDGAFELTSEPQTGTIASLWLPVAEVAAEVAPAQATVGRPARRCRILVVDDNPAVLQIVARPLERAGHEVYPLDDPAAALAGIRSGQLLPELLVTDVVMPNVSGPDLVAAARERLPELPVLFISGYAKSDAQEKMLSTPRTAFLAKPFTPEAIEARVAALLRGEAPRGDGATRARTSLATPPPA
jgi:PAS domain S-box-containing protein